MYVCVDKKISTSGFRLKRITLALDFDTYVIQLFSHRFR